ncbi:hypothetical protein A2U01_0113153, partial [Trifolium medium]|nr:hypothetical protein [Trifolium medium]
MKAPIHAGFERPPPLGTYDGQTDQMSILTTLMPSSTFE